MPIQQAMIGAWGRIQIGRGSIAAAHRRIFETIPTTQIRWLTRHVRSRICRLARATWIPWGATQPRLVPAIRPMWKHRHTPRRPVGLESLNGGAISASSQEIAIVPSVADFETMRYEVSNPASGFEGQPVGPVESGAWGPRATPVTVESTGWNAGSDPAAAPVDASATGETLEAGRYVAAFHAQPASAFQWDGAASDAPPFGSSVQSETMFFIDSAGMASFAANPGGAPAASAVPPSPMPGAPGTGAPGNGTFDPYSEFDPGDSMAFARTDADPTTMALVFTPPGLSTMAFTFARDRFDPSEAGLPASSSNPVTPISGPSTNGASIQALYGPGGTGGQTTATATSAAPGGSGLQALSQSIPLADPGGGGEHPIPGAVSLQRPGGTGPFEPGRPNATVGRSMLATTLAHSLHVSADQSQGASTDLRDPLILAPQAADLIAESLPFSGSSLERSLDDFVRQLEEVDVAALVGSGPAPILIASLAVLSTATSAVVVREIVRRRAERDRGIRIVDSVGRELALSFPELPRSWSEKRR